MSHSPAFSSTALSGFLNVDDKTYRFADLSSLDTLGEWRKLPFSLKIVLENLVRYEDGHTVLKSDIEALVNSCIDKRHKDNLEISFRPARVLMQDLTGVPAIVDLAAMRDAMVKNGKNPELINPKIPLDMVIDHSVMMDFSASKEALSQNVELEYKRNLERYEFLKWGTKAFQNFKVVPPGVGICHQVNLEYLAKVVWSAPLEDGSFALYPDTVVGTDSHTTMINGLSVLGWGVGGIEAEAAMLGQPISMLVPEVLGVELKGALPAGCTATDLVLTITQILRAKGVVGKFVEFFGEGVKALSLADRATIANMAPEYGATCGIFGIDEETLSYLRLTGRSEHEIKRVELYAKAQGLWTDPTLLLSYNEVLTIQLSDVEPSLAGPKRPQDKVGLRDLKNVTASLQPVLPEPVKVKGQSYGLTHHDVVLAAITSCTNTSNPAVLIAAGLVAKKAKAFGLSVKPWVKTSFAPGSQVVGDYLEKAGLMQDLEALGFHISGFGCTTCIGNSGPLPFELGEAIQAHNLTVAGVLSGNRNFEGRIHPHVKANYLASPPLVVAFALAGTTNIDLTAEAIGISSQGEAIYLKDIWPSQEEIQTIIESVVTPDLYIKRYGRVLEGDENWQQIEVKEGQTFNWHTESTYIQNPPYFNEFVPGEKIQGMKPIQKGNIRGARILALLGDSITTDHISPAGNIKPSTPAGQYLTKHQVEINDFNSYGSRRGNHEVMVRGTFANIRLQNEQVPEQTGGITRDYSNSNDETENKTSSDFSPLSIFEASIKYMNQNIPLVVIAGKEYGTGSSRDWAAKGTRLLGVQAVIAESFERIHRSNLVGMGVLPLLFEPGVSRKTLELKGDEVIDIEGFDEKGTIVPKMKLTAVIHKSNGENLSVPLICRVDTLEEVEYMKAGGILNFVLQGSL